MTLVDATYRSEIFGLLAAARVPVLHVFLEVPPDELRRRIDAQVLDTQDPRADAAAREFRLRNVDRCVAARGSLPPDTLVLRADRDGPARLAARVLDALASGSRCP